MEKTHSTRERRRAANLIMGSVLTFAGLAGLVLYRFAPAAYGFYPVCPIHEYLHLECPGCGTTRALSALLHGHLREALRLNALMIGLVLPGAAVYGLLSYVEVFREDVFRWLRITKSSIYASLGLVLAYTVLRNL